MNKLNFGMMALLFALLQSGHSFAAMHDVVFERVAMVQGQDAYMETITLHQDTQFVLTLTDFAFPDKLDSLGVTLVSATQSFGSLLMEKTAPDDLGWGHSWGAGFEQKSLTGQLEAGTYYLSMNAQFNADWHVYDGMQYGLYGVEMIATPVPASIIFMLSGLGVFRFMSRRKQALPA
ncbi:MAG: hypothetical protein C9356_05735 [Oleiphilus sp.]|nr:MAG: hypothetical protein C9356_05735 [Oleiphilus sp.]